MVEHPSELAFDLALLGHPREGFEAHLAGCPACAARLASLRQGQAALAASEVPAQAARRALLRQRRRRWAVAAPVGLAIAAGLLALALAPKPPAVRTKGGPAVQAFVRRGGRVLPLAGAGPLAEGDAVQLTYRAAGFARVSVFSLEAGCAARLERAEEAAPEGAVGESFRLTGPSGSERLYLAFSDAPLGAEALEAALKAAGGCRAGAAPRLEGAGFVALGVALRGGER